MQMAGGFVGSVPAPIPRGARVLWSGRTAVLWSVGDGGLLPVCLGAAGERAVVAAVGFCGATGADLRALAERGPGPRDVFRWAGAYALIAAADGRLSMFSDLASAVPLYWVRTGEGFAWCTSARALAALVETSVDAQWLSAWLAWPGTPAVLADRSAFAGVAMIPPGRRLDLAAGDPPRLRAVWRPVPDGDAGPDALGDTLRAAVRTRVVRLGSVSADLSGGLDSTTLARLAGEAAAEVGRTVGAVTFHPKGVLTGGDLDYARIGAAHPGIDHRWLARDATHLPYTDIGLLPPTDEPAPGAPGAAFWLDQLRFARDTFGAADERHHHVTGDGGDAVLTAPLAYLADLWRTRRRRRALRHAIGWSSLYRTSAFPVIRDVARTAGTTRADAMYQVADAIGKRASIGGIASWFPTPIHPSWATTRLREQAGHAIADAAGQVEGQEEPAETTAHVMWENIIEIGRTAAADGHLAAAAAGVVQHNPFADSAVITAALSVSPANWASPWRFKPLLSAALPGVLPVPVTARTTKGDLTADHIRGLRANLPDLLELADGHLAGLGLIEPEAFRALLTRAAAGTLTSLGTVQPVIAAETWIRSLMNATAPVWTTLAGAA